VTIDGRELKSVLAADVYKGDRLAGQLLREHDDVVFLYEEGYLEDPSTPAVAMTLPKSAGAVRSSAGAVPPFFAGLLPEGARLQAVTTATQTSTDDQLTLLLLVGADTIGDVRIVPAGEAPSEPPTLLDPSGSGRDDFDVVFALATSADAAKLDRIALPGVQIKVSASMISTPLRTTAAPAIFKLSPPEYPTLVANEYFFLRMAAGCGIPVPRCHLIHDRAGRPGLVVERFDRVTDGKKLRRLAQEDACQLLGRYPAARYRLSLQEVAGALSAAVEVGAGSRRLALRRIIEIASFSYLIGNGDLHGKNLSVRCAPTGLWEVTPAYDLVSTQPYTGWQDPMALSLYGRANRLTRRWWLDGAVRLGLSERAAARAIDRIADAAEPWLDRLPEVGLDERSTSRLRELIEGRRAELAGSAGGRD
jgi:serine/threonine-protein kinase HipA